MATTDIINQLFGQLRLTYIYEKELYFIENVHPFIRIERRVEHEPEKKILQLKSLNISKCAIKNDSCNKTVT